MKAVTYARYSSDRQRETSIADQQRNMHRRAQAEGWSVVRDYADAAISGATAERPKYQALLKAANAKEFDVLLVDDLSRLSRDSVESERAIRQLEFSGVRIISVSDGYDSTSKSRKIQRGFKGLMNEAFLDDLAERVHRGQEGQARKGRWNGGRPYGYRLKKLTDATRLDQYGEPARIGTELVVDEAQAKIVREIFRSYDEGLSLLSIASDLNRRNVPSPGSSWNRKARRAEKWVHSSVREILKNRLYTGRVTWNKRKFQRDPSTGRHIARRRPQSEHVITPVPSLRIVSDDVFDAIAARLERNKDPDIRLRQGGKLRHPLSGLLKCAHCGRSFVIRDKYNYACHSFISGGPHACINHQTLKRDALEHAVFDDVVAKLLEPQRMQRLAQELADEMNKARKQEAEAPALKALDERIARLRRRLKDGDPDLDADELQAAINAAEAKRAKVAKPPRASISILTTLPAAAAKMRQEIERGINAKGDLQETARTRDILRQLLGEIRIRVDAAGVWAEFEQQSEKLLLANQSHMTVVGVKVASRHMRILIKPVAS